MECFDFNFCWNHLWLNNLQSRCCNNSKVPLSVHTRMANGSYEILNEPLISPFLFLLNHSKNSQKIQDWQKILEISSQNESISSKVE